MTTIRYKDDFVYIFFISLLTYLGMYFLNPFSGVLFKGSELSFQLGANFLIFLNAVIVYKIFKEIFSEGKTALILSCLYVVTPLQFDKFFHPFQIQASLAETFLLVFSFMYILGHSKKAIGCLLLAIVLNTKLLFLLPLICFSNKFKKQEKIFLGIIFLYLLIQLFPLFHEQQWFLLRTFRTPIYLIEMLLFPLNINFLDFSLLINYYSNALLFSIGVLLTCLLAFSIYKKYKFVTYFLLLFVVALLGSFIPYKQVIFTRAYAFYFLPTLYPTVLLGALILIGRLLQKYPSKYYAFLICLFGGMWLYFNISFQSRSSNVISSWENSMRMLPKRYYFDQKMKLRYAYFLLDDKQLDKAKAFIEQAKLDYPDESWYELLLMIANAQKDDAGIKKVYDDLVRNRIPYKIPDTKN